MVYIIILEEQFKFIKRHKNEFLINHDKNYIIIRRFYNII